MASELSERKAFILRALIRHYVRTGEPVGSESLAGAEGLEVSPATIRNELAALEEMGYLTQPHTSAGRKPTDLGYRHYVDALPARPRLRDPERRAILGFFDEALADVDEILQGTTRLLSRLTRYASLALAPSLKEAGIARCELIALGSATLLLVVFETGQVEKRVIDVPADLGPEDVQRFARDVEAEFPGNSVDGAVKAAAARAGDAAEPSRTLWTLVGDALSSIEQAAGTEHVFLGGFANIAMEDTFHRGETLREIFEALERQSELLALLREAAEAPPVSVTIGRESPITAMWEAAVVAAPYQTGGRTVGTIGVVGPTRMDYGAAISAVRAVAERLSAAVQALEA